MRFTALVVQLDGTVTDRRTHADAAFAPAVVRPLTEGFRLMLREHLPATPGGQGKFVAGLDQAGPLHPGLAPAGPVLSRGRLLPGGPVGLPVRLAVRAGAGPRPGRR